MLVQVFLLIFSYSEEYIWSARVIFIPMVFYTYCIL